VRPALAIADGTLGLRMAVHKTAKRALREVWMAVTKAAAAFDAFTAMRPTFGLISNGFHYQ
jgi:hypothetical protein